MCFSSIPNLNSHKISLRSMLSYDRPLCILLLQLRCTLLEVNAPWSSVMVILGVLQLGYYISFLYVISCFDTILRNVQNWLRSFFAPQKTDRCYHCSTSEHRQIPRTGNLEGNCLLLQESTDRQTVGHCQVHYFPAFLLTLHFSELYKNI